MQTYFRSKARREELAYPKRPTQLRQTAVHIPRGGSALCCGGYNFSLIEESAGRQFNRQPDVPPITSK